MKPVFAPFFIAVIVSFLLGLWFSMSRIDSRGGHPKISPTKLRLLALNPSPWVQLINKIDNGQVRVLVHQDPDEFEELLRDQVNSCDLVALDSWTQSHFIQQKLIRPINMDSLKNSNFINPDFRGLKSDPDGRFIIPLYWSLADWRARLGAPVIESLSQVASSAAWRGKVAHLTWPLDQLTLAFDLAPEVVEDDLDEDEESEPLQGEPFEKISESVFGSSTNASVPADQIFLVRAYLTSAQGQKYKDWQSLPQLPHGDLWTTGLGLCVHSQKVNSAIEFLDLILEHPAYFASVSDSSLASTLNTSEYADIAEYKKASSLRSHPLGRIQARDFPWGATHLWLKKLAQESSSSPKQN